MYEYILIPNMNKFFSERIQFSITLQMVPFFDKYCIRGPLYTALCTIALFLTSSSLAKTRSKFLKFMISWIWKFEILIHEKMRRFLQVSTQCCNLQQHTLTISFTCLSSFKKHVFLSHLLLLTRIFPLDRLEDKKEYNLTHTHAHIYLSEKSHSYLILKNNPFEKIIWW